LGLIIKICGLREQADAELAAELGADLLGFIHEPTSKRFVGEHFSPGWLDDLAPPKVAVFGPATGQPDRAFSFIQAHTWPDEWSDPRSRIVTYRVGSGLPIPDVTGAAYVLLDAFDPNQHGGSGKVIDWGLAADLVDQLPIPVILAGGLNPDNVADGIRRVRPAGVDVSSGIEKAPGIKDSERLRAFIENARSAN